MSDSTKSVPPSASGFSLSDAKTRGWLFQILTVLILFWMVWWIVDNTVANMTERNLASGFGFLEETAGFGILQSLIGYSEESSYGRVFIVGILNTLLLAIVGCFFATILGFIMGVARLSKNWVINKVATVFVETLRNIPLLLQIFFWYHAVLKPLPGPRSVHEKGEAIWFSLTNNGMMLPKPIPEDGFSIVFIAFVIGVVCTMLLKSWAKKRQMSTGQIFPTFWAGMGLILGIPVLIYLILGQPIHWEAGVMGSFRPDKNLGLNIIPEFIALLLALSVYTAAFIAEIVRAGITSVNHGQTEAAYALGVKPSRTLRLIIIPQALRVIVPPLTSQYLNLTKNSSLGAAIAYPELVAIFAGTVLNQTGQAVEVMLMTLSVYLCISLTTSIFMNWYNKKVKLVER